MNKQSTQSAETPTVKTAVEARGAKTIRGGAIRRVMLTSVVLAAVAMFIAFLVVR